MFIYSLEMVLSLKSGDLKGVLNLFCSRLLVPVGKDFCPVAMSVHHVTTFINADVSSLKLLYDLFMSKAIRSM